ncbi:MAG: hypothetical protein ACFBSE_17480 [Prochloraceae cyanobacterium]
MSEIIRSEQSGVEYFTVQATGESGLSISGIARLCGVNQSSITRLTQDLMHKAASKWLESCVGKDLYLMQSYIKKGGEVKIIKAEVAAAIIRHYAIERKIETAILALSMFSDAGITIFIQQMTGWQPALITTSSPAEPTIEEIERVFAPLYKLGIKEGLIESAKLTSIAVSIPRLLSSVENAKQLISASLPTEEIPVSPTQLGIIFANRNNLDKPPSGQKVNQALLNAGFQFKNEQKDWQLTEAGEKYGQQQFETVRKKNKTIVVIRWFPSVLERIRQYL